MKTRFATILMILVLALPHICCRHKYTTLNTKDVKAIESNRVYHYFDLKGNPLNGNFIIKDDRISVKTHFTKGLVDGPYVHQDLNSHVEMRLNYVNGVQHGVQEKYRDGIIGERNNFYYGTMHGIATVFDEHGKFLEERYIINGDRIMDKDNFEKMMKEQPCQKSKVTVTTIPSNDKGVTPYIIDTIKVEKGVMLMSRTYPKDFFKYQGHDMDSIKFTIFSSTYRISSPGDFHYTAAPNEIVFYYGVDSAARERQRYFVFGAKTKKASDKEQITVLTIIKYLEHQVFGIAPFSGLAAADALEKAIGKKKD